MRLDLTQRQVRVRASENAIRAALHAMQGAGLAVEKLCVNGGKVEIHCRGIEPVPTAQEDGGLKDW
jgi:hypothetical protein